MFIDTLRYKKDETILIESRWGLLKKIQVYWIRLEIRLSQFMKVFHIFSPD